MVTAVARGRFTVNAGKSWSTGEATCPIFTATIGLANQIDHSESLYAG